MSEEIAWAVRYHQPLRYFADPSVGYEYPEAYRRSSVRITSRPNT